MMSLAADHLWQSTLFAAAAALLTLVFRRSRADVRYAIWLAASIKFLVPFAALSAIGSRLNVWANVDAPPPRQGIAFTLDVATQPFTQPFSQTPFAVASSASLNALAPSSVDALLPVVVAGIWACGAGALIGRWILHWRRMTRIVSAATPLHSGHELAILRELQNTRRAPRHLTLVSTAERLEPGVFGIRRPVLLWPRTIAGHMTPAEVEAVVAHEICHARRHDNLAAALHMLVEALFWFHPLTWWIGARLIDERERACDEEVLRRGEDPQLYAATILKTCKLYLTSPVTCVSGVTGADLRRRIARVMSHTHPRALTWSGRTLLVTLAACAVGAPVLAAAFMPPRALGLGGSRFFQHPRLLMAWAPRIDMSDRDLSRARFESVSLKASTPDGPSTGVRPLAGGRVTASALRTVDLMRVAYFPELTRMEMQLEGAPEWVFSERFDLVARAGHELVNDAGGEPRELVAMLRNLLTDRFNLRIHTEIRQMAVQALVLVDPDGGTGSGLRPTVCNCWRPGDHPMPRVPVHPSRWCKTSLTGEAIEAASMTWLARTMSGLSPTPRLVKDETGLTGSFDFRFPPPTSDRSAAETFEQELGLRLEPRVSQVPVYIVDHIERPMTD